MRATIIVRREGWRELMGLASLSPPGLIVNHLKGDPAERRVNGWLVGAMLVLNFFMGVASGRA